MMRRIFLNPLLDTEYPEIADTLWHGRSVRELTNRKIGKGPADF